MPQENREKEKFLRDSYLGEKRMGTIKIRARITNRERKRGRALHSPSSPICWLRSFKDTLASLGHASQSHPIAAVDKILHLSPFSKARLIATPFRPGQKDRQRDTAPFLLRMSATAKSLVKENCARLRVRTFAFCIFVTLASKVG